MKNTKVVLVFLLMFAIPFLISCKKGTNNAEQPIQPVLALPSLSILDVSKTRGPTNSLMQFNVYASTTSTSPMLVDYIVTNGTAIAGVDYIASSGTITIAPGQNVAYLDIQINGNANNLRQANRQFTIQFSNPKFCTLSNNTVNGNIMMEDGTYLPTDNTGYTTPLTYPGYTLAWSDEFSAASLNTNDWNQETGNNNGWGNNELENYTNSLKNTFLSNGNLIIEARKEPSNGFNYSSGRMTTQNKKNFKFGRIDIRAKLPVGKGIWPALWMLGSNINTVGWPQCGEIDIMELVGTNPNRVSGTIHYKNTSGTRSFLTGNYFLPNGVFSDQFHVFSIIWQQDLLKWYVDDILYFSKSAADLGGATNPFNANEFFLFNVAVGGDWPGSPDATTVFPQRMFVDYVRVFQ